MNSDKYIPHRRNSLEDLVWIRQHDPCVLELWADCVTAEGFGDSFNQLETKLSEKSFRKAKRILENVLFEFKPIYALSTKGRTTVTGWLVRNLHGWKNREYWLTSSHVPTDYQRKVLPPERENLPPEREQLPPERENLPEESAVVFDTTVFDSSPITNSKNKTNNSFQVDKFSFRRSSHSGEEAPLRVASPSAPSAKTSQGKSGASLISKEVEPDLLHRISTNQDGASRFVQKTPPEVEDSAAPHVTPRQNDTHPREDAPRVALPSKQTNPVSGQATYPSGAYSAESNRIIDAFLERLPFQYQEQAEDFFRNPQAIALFDQNLPCDVENALKVVTRYIEKKSVDNLGGLINKAIAQGWKPRPAQPAQPPAPSNNPLDGIPPVDAATLAALEAANLDPDLHQMCLNRFPTQYPGVRMKTIENAAYEQLIRNEKK